MKSRLYSALRIIISLSLIGLLFYLRRDSLHLTVEAIKGLKPQLFISSCVIFILAAVVFAARLKVLLSAQGLPLKFHETVSLTFIGYFFNNFLPTAIGGDVVKAYYTFKKTDNKLNSFVSVFMDRFIGFITLFILAGISLIFSYTYIKEKFLIWFTLSILSILLFIFALFFNERLALIFSPFIRLVEFLKIKDKMRKIYEAINAFKNKKGAILKAILISVIAQIICFFVIYLLSKGMGSFISIRMVLLLMPLVSIVSMLPSINGLGVRESAIYFLFGPYLGYKNAFALSLLWLFILFLVGFIGGINYLLGKQYKTKNFNKEE